MRPGATRRRGLWAGLALLLAWPAAQAALRVPYGGELVAHVFGAPVSLDRHRPSGPADRSAQAALFEPLYRLDAAGALVPVLAEGPPAVSGRTVQVRLRPGVRLHDGRLLTPALAAEALEGLAGGAGAHVLAPVAALSPTQDGLRFELVAPYDAFPRLLAGAHAGLALPSPAAGREVGTGPFQVEARDPRGGLTLTPFLAHRAGRPYLDRVTLLPYSSRSGAAAWARRGEAAVLFGVPDGHGPDDPHLQWPAPGAAPWSAPLERVLLRLGPGPRRAERLAALSRALQRERLVERFMDPAARPAARLLLDAADPGQAERAAAQRAAETGGPAPPARDPGQAERAAAHRAAETGGPAPPARDPGQAERAAAHRAAETGGPAPPARDPGQAERAAAHRAAETGGPAPPARDPGLSLVVSQADRAGWQFAKRVQLDLLRAGVVTTLRRVEPEALTAALLDPGADELVLATVLPDAPHSGDPADGLHTLLSLAAALGSQDALPQEALLPFFAASRGERAALLPGLEARVRAALGVVPLAIRPPGLLLRAEVGPLWVDTQGSLQFDEAHRPLGGP